MQRLNVLMVGADLTSNGGIASVIKCYYNEWQKSHDNLKLYFLKTSYYKDKKPAFEVFLFIKAFFKAFAIITSKNIHIVHIHSSSGFSFYRKSIFLILSKILFKKVILHIHASRFYDFFLSNNRFLEFYIHQILKISDLTLTLCYDWEKKLKSFYSDIKVKTIHNPITIKRDLNVNNSKRADDTFRVLFMGFLIPSKGILDLLEIAKKFSDNNIKDIQFNIAGKGDLEKILNDTITKYKLKRIVKYEGWVTGSKKNDLFYNADILFLPSYKEGMPICILEAMSNYLPVVSTNVSGIPDLVIGGFNGYLCKPGQIDQFYEIIVNLYMNKILLSKLGQNSYKHVQSFSSDKLYRKLLNIYNQIMSKDISQKNKKDIQLNENMRTFK